MPAFVLFTLHTNERKPPQGTCDGWFQIHELMQMVKFTHHLGISYKLWRMEDKQ